MPVVLARRSGRVVSGRGQATSLFAGRPELAEYFGAEPQPGTLNIVLDWPTLFRPERTVVRLDDIHRLLWPATVEDQRCLVQRWPSCPLHVIELISPYRFQVREGDRIQIRCNPVDIEPVLWRQLLGWSGLWLAFRKRAYSDDRYFDWANSIAERYPRYFSQQTTAAVLPSSGAGSPRADPIVKH